MKTIIRKLLKPACLLALIFTFISCEPNYESVDTLYAEAGNQEIYAYWYFTDGTPSIVKVDISPRPKDTDTSYPAKTTYTDRLITGLENGTKYTITVMNFSDKGKEISRKSVTVTPTQDVEIYKYDKEKPYIKVPSDRTFVTLTGVKDKLITFANVNTGNRTIAKDQERIYRDKLNRRSLNPQEEIKPAQKTPGPRFITPHTLHDYVPKESDVNARSAAVNANEIPSGEEIDIEKLKIGDTRKLYLDCNIKFFTCYPEEDPIKYQEEKDVTLCGIGKKDDKIICLVWVDNDSYGEVSRENKVSSRLAQNLADIFVDYYFHEREIAGEETTPSNSLTGDAVNLVLYDLANDYSENKEDNYLGYFYSNDYGDGKKSNHGKYLYLDAPICNIVYDSEGKKSFDGNKKDDQEVPSGWIISTIIHEFQHLIQYSNHGYKGKYTESWYTEMLSMLMEDALYDDMHHKYSLSFEEGVQNRLTQFNYSYNYDWTKSPFDPSCYAPCYAFGAWLVRNYGGVQLLQKICHNEKTNLDAILDSVKALSTKPVTINSLREQYLTACAIYTENSNGTNLPTFNRTSGEPLASYDHTSKFLPIDLFAEEFYWTDSRFNRWKGPLLFKKESRISDIPPYTFLLRTGINATRDTVSLLFTKSQNKDESLYIFIQDNYDNQVK